MWHLIHPGMWSSVLQILLLLSLTGASLTINEKNCFELAADSGCRCISKLQHWTIKCPGVEIFMEIRKESGKHVLFEQWNETKNNSLPKMNIGNCHGVDIVNCKLSGVSIVLLLDQLGIKNVKNLYIHNNILADNFTRVLIGLSGLEELYLGSNDIVLLPLDVFTVLSNVTTLSIHENLVDLPQHIFDPLEKLTTLDLAKNRLNQLPTGIFRNQHRLKELMLNDNEMRNINKTTFEGATSLQRLDLSNNNFDRFEPDVFSLLPTLTKIYLGGNELHELPSQLFANNKNLTILHIYNNRNAFGFLPTALFANLSQLQQVHISCSNYSWEKYSDFFGLEYVRSLIYESCGFPGNFLTQSNNWTYVSLSGNNLTSVPDSLFVGLLNLFYLDLSHNALHSLQDDVFRTISSLRFLDLTYNQLLELSGESFLSFRNLKRLHLDHNKLKLLPDGLFLKTFYLIQLKLSYNQLIEISAAVFAPLVKLEELYLDNNCLKTISPDAFSECRNIRYINMDNNHINLQVIAPFDTPFHLPEKLETLKLRNNSIQHIYWNWRTALPELKELDLSLNNISMLDYRDSTFKQKGLLVNISHNQVRTIDFEGENLMSETSYILIDINYNPLDCDCKLLSFLLYLHRSPYSKTRFITDSLFCEKPDDRRLRLFRDLKPEELTCVNENCPHGCFCWERTYDATLIFNCSNTNLTKVPLLSVVPTNAFKAIELHIENNELLELPIVSIDGYENVTKIYATGNNIGQITVHNLPMKLTHLDLSHNNLKRLDPDVIDFFKGSHSLTKLTLTGNPWECNCESRLWLVFAESQSYITDYKKIFCATPKNATMHDYIFENECQEDHGVIFISIVSVLSVSLLFAVIVTVRYKYETEMKIWMYSCPRLRGIFSEFDVDEDKKYDAFVSYAHKDQEFIGTTLVPELERDGPIRYNLCVHVRDFIVGDYITDQIIRAINDSRRTIIVLSKYFIESVWACFEFRLAHQAAVEEGRTRVIVIMYGDIGDIDLLEPTLRAYLKTNTYLEWGDPRFWDRLRFAMPHPVNAPANETSQVTTAV